MRCQRKHDEKAAIGSYIVSSDFNNISQVGSDTTVITIPTLSRYRTAILITGAPRRPRAEQTYRFDLILVYLEVCKARSTYVPACLNLLLLSD